MVEMAWGLNLLRAHVLTLFIGLKIIQVKHYLFLLYPFEIPKGHAVLELVEALCLKPEDRGFDS
jgi:hypothetical protein